MHSRLSFEDPLAISHSVAAITLLILGTACSGKSGNADNGNVGGNTGSGSHSGGSTAAIGGTSASGTGGFTNSSSSAANNSGGATSSAGGMVASGGSNNAATGGATRLSTGGSTGNNGGTGATLTTSKANTGGISPTTGGKSATGGVSSGIGGKSATGGVSSGIGGTSATNGGSSAAVGGKTGASGGTSATQGGASSVNDGKIRWVGRVVPIDATSAKFAWQGAGLIANVSGSTISVKLRTEGTDTVYFQPVIDHTALDRFKVDKGTDATVTLGTGLGTGEHLVELYRETEGYYGMSTFLGFTAGTVTGAPANNGRLLEVVGDSISAGYGNLGVEPHPNWTANPACTWTAQNSSWHATYAAIAGHALDAEVSTIAKSGWGMYRDNGNNTSNVLSKVYPNALGMTDPTKWDFAPKASAVVINLGTNDWANNYQGSQDPGVGYETAYVQFIATVRGHYPDAWIFLVIGPMLGDTELSQVKTRLASVVSKVQSSTNDTKIATFDFGSQNLGSNGEIPSGCDWHPSVDEHKRMAGILQTQLTAKLGW